MALERKLITPTIGYAGFTRSAGEVRITPIILAIWGWEAACKIMIVEGKYQKKARIHRALINGVKLTFNTTAPPVEWPKRKHGIARFFDLIFSRNEPYYKGNTRFCLLKKGIYTLLQHETIWGPRTDALALIMTMNLKIGPAYLQYQRNLRWCKIHSQRSTKWLEELTVSVITSSSEGTYPWRPSLPPCPVESSINTKISYLSISMWLGANSPSDPISTAHEIDCRGCYITEVSRQASLSGRKEKT